MGEYVMGVQIGSYSRSEINLETPNYRWGLVGDGVRNLHIHEDNGAEELLRSTKCSNTFFIDLVEVSSLKSFSVSSLGRAALNRNRSHWKEMESRMLPFTV
jgi:hypothetical protein